MVYNHKFEVKPEVIADAVSTEIKRWFRKWQFSLTLCTENVLTQGGGWLKKGQNTLKIKIKDGPEYNNNNFQEPFIRWAHLSKGRRQKKKKWTAFQIARSNGTPEVNFWSGAAYLMPPSLKLSINLGPLKNREGI